MKPTPLWRDPSCSRRLDNDEPRIADVRSRVHHHYGGYEAGATAGLLSIIMDATWTMQPTKLPPHPQNQYCLKAASTDSPVCDLCRELETPEGGQQAGHALLKAFRLPRIPGRRHNGNVDVGAHQRYYVTHLHQQKGPFRVFLSRLAFRIFTPEPLCATHWTLRHQLDLLNMKASNLFYSLLFSNPTPKCSIWQGVQAEWQMCLGMIALSTKPNQD